MSLIKEGIKKMIVTFYDSRNDVILKYTNGLNNILFIEKEIGQENVMFNIDATNLDSSKLGKFDMIFFYFPHTGTPNKSEYNVSENTNLIQFFLSCCVNIMNKGCEVQIALKGTQPYSTWIDKSLKELPSGIKLVSQLPFDDSYMPGYVHRTTLGDRNSLKKVNNTNASIFSFCTDNNNSTASEDSELQLLTDLCVNVSIVITPDTPDERADDIVRERALEFLPLNQNDGLNKLQIRRLFQAGGENSYLPPSSQINRVLYALEQSGHVFSSNLNNNQMNNNNNNNNNKKKKKKMKNNKKNNKNNKNNNKNNYKSSRPLWWKGVSNCGSSPSTSTTAAPCTI
jgi:hypothetical protein